MLVSLTSTTRNTHICDQSISMVKYLDYDELKVHMANVVAFSQMDLSLMNVDMVTCCIQVASRRIN